MRLRRLLRFKSMVLRRALHTGVAFCLVGIAPYAAAAQLGPLQIFSVQGQPFSSQLIFAADAEELPGILLEIISVECGLERCPKLTLDGENIADPAAPRMVARRIVSAEPVIPATLAVQIRLTSPTQIMVRAYRITLDQPLFAPPPRPSPRKALAQDEGKATSPAQEIAKGTPPPEPQGTAAELQQAARTDPLATADRPQLPDTPVSPPAQAIADAPPPPEKSAPTPAPGAPTTQDEARALEIIARVGSHRKEVGNAAAEQVLKVLQDWAEAWSQRDVDRYLGFYAESFTPSDGSPRVAWAAARRERILAPSMIRVSLENVNVIAQSDIQVVVQFRQDYNAIVGDRKQRMQGRKQLILEHTSSGWQITSEEIQPGRPMQ